MTDSTCPIPEDALARLFQESVLTSAEFLCQVMWQAAPKKARAPYPQFRLSPDAFKLQSHLYRIAPNRLEEEDIIEVLDAVVPLRDLYGDAGADESQLGSLLRHASFAQCSLGGVACPGDLRRMIRSLERGTIASDVAMPSDLLARYRHGDHATMRTFLNALLAESVEKLEAIEAAGTDNPQKRVFFIERSSGDPVIDGHVYETQYYCIISLLKLVEGEQGHA